LEVPIRAELLGVERLKPHAESLAAAQVVFSEPRLYPLLTRVFWKTATCCWSPTESLPGRISRSMGSVAAHLGKEGKPEMIIPKISQDTLAVMVGTTRSRVGFL
jgi:hypothetical protein